MAKYGMLAFGRCGNWELAVDELIGESAKWVLQISSPIVSMQCGVPTLSVFSDLQKCLLTGKSTTLEHRGPCPIGECYGRIVSVTLDSEYANRCFISIGDSASSRFEVTLAGQDFADFQNALTQIVNDLDLKR